MQDKTYAVKITAEGKISLVEMSRECEMAFVEAIQREVGGYFEIVYADLPVTDDIAIHLDEAGKFTGKPINRIATALYNNPRDVIVGDVLLMPIEVDPESEYGERDSMPVSMIRAMAIKSFCEKVADERLRKKEETK